MRIESLHIYPLKSARGIDLTSCTFDGRGAVGDRRLMLVDRNGNFITQRSHPMLARLIVSQTRPNCFAFEFDGNRCTADFNDNHTRKPVTVWRSQVDAPVMAAPELSRWLGSEVQIAYMDGAASRSTNDQWVNAPSEVSFADGYPVLVTNTASLDALNAAIMERAQNADAAIPMNRFRPNIVVSGAEAWAEDTWSVLRCGDIELHITIPCTRCVMVTQDQTTGEAVNNEPSATLMRMRRSAHPEVQGLLFGVNAVIRRTGSVNVGDAVTVVEVAEMRWPLRQQ